MTLVTIWMLLWRFLDRKGFLLSACRTWTCAPCSKISDPFASNAPNSVYSSWILMKCYYVNITYGHTHYDVCTLPCVLDVTSLWRQSLFTLRLRSIRCYWQRDQAAVYLP